MWTEIDYTDELYHHGIKGQKWGRRRFQDESGKLTQAGKERYRAYKQDYKTAVKLNRHVAASQKHLKEEGVMLDRVRDKYLKTNRDYQKAMTKSAGLFGSKSAEKAEKVARAQLKMDKAKSDYNNAAGAYGVAKKFASEDAKALKDHVDGMIQNYGKSSIGSFKTETVKMGQSKFQKLLHGAPMSIVLNKGRATEELVKTGKTLADVPIIGNFYTARYIGKKEMDNDLGSVDRTINSKNPQRAKGKDGKDPSYLNPDYFDDASSSTKDRLTRKMDKAKKEYDEAQKDYDASKNQWRNSFDRVQDSASRVQLADVDRTVARNNYRTVKTQSWGWTNPNSIPNSIISGRYIKATKQAGRLAKAKWKYAGAQTKYQQSVEEYNGKNAQQRKDAEHIFESSNKLSDAASKYYKLERKQKKRRKR